MGSFGERLQREREMRGITLEEIAEATKIGTRSLRALEEEDFAKLPGGIFNRGFVRAYARYLGIDEEQAVNDFRAVCKEEEQPLPNPTDRKKEEIPVPRESSGAKWVVLALLLLVAGGVASWRMGWLRKPMAPQARPAHASKPDTNEPSPVTPSTVQAAVPEAGTRGPASTPSTSPTPAEQAGSPVRSASERSLAPPPGSTMSAATPGAESTLNAATSAPTPFTLDIKATQDSWVEIMVDGKLVARELMRASGERSFSANHQIQVRTGNSAALEFSHNGKPLTVASEQGKPRTFTFTAEGLQP